MSFFYNGSSVSVDGGGAQLLLHRAASVGHRAVVEYLLLRQQQQHRGAVGAGGGAAGGSGARVTMATTTASQTDDDEEGQPHQYQQQPLHVAARYGHVAVAELLLRRRGGANDVRAPDQEGRQPLYAAAESPGGHLPMAEFLVRRRAAPDAAAVAGAETTVSATADGRGGDSGDHHRVGGRGGSQAMHAAAV